MKDCKTDLSIALSWAVFAKNSLKNVNGFNRLGSKYASGH